MPLEHFDRFFAFVAVGLGLLLAGGLNLAFGRSGRFGWVRGAVTLAVCGGVIAGLAALTRPELALRNGGLLLGVLALVTLLGSAWFSRQLTALIAVCRAPAARWGLVSLSGLGVILGGALAFDRADEAASDQHMKNLEFVLGRPATHPTDRERATTDRGTAIVLRAADAPREASELIGPEEKTLRESPYYKQLIHCSGPSDTSNCHGWVFTGGKYFLAPDAVEAIVKENGYHEVQEPQPGDLVVYRQGGTVAHTAIVRYVTEGQPVMVEGKWGTLGVYRHAAEMSFYGTEYTFHRSARTGHLLVGLGGSPGPAEATATTTD